MTWNNSPLGINSKAELGIEPETSRSEGNEIITEPRSRSTLMRNNNNNSNINSNNNY